MSKQELKSHYKTKARLQEFRHTCSMLKVFFAAAFFTHCGMIAQEPENPLKALLEAQGQRTDGAIEIQTALHAFNNFNRRCETRIGNLITDALRDKAGSDIAIMNGGGIRPLDNSQPNNLPVNTVPKGTLQQLTINTILPFANQLTVVRLTGFRLKQVLEHSAAAITTPQFAGQNDDADADGPIHGVCYSGATGGGATPTGGFLQMSGIKVIINPNNARRVTDGATPPQVTTQGRRVIKIEVLQGGVYSEIYNNPTGDPATGWAAGSASCTIKSYNYTASAACRQFTLGTSDFYVDNGGDGYSVLMPTSAEVNDGTVTKISANLGLNREIVWAYLENRAGLGLPIKPIIEGRIQYSP